MARVFKYSASALLALVALALLAMWVARMAGPGHAQREALELMRQPWRPDGRNAFDAAWLLRYDVPESAMAGVVERDMRRIASAPPVDAHGRGGIADFASEAKVGYIDLQPSAADLELACKPREDGCLAKVRANLGEYQAMVSRNARLYARIEALSQYGHFANKLPQRVDAPFPAFQLGSASLTRHAVSFARGDVDGALEGACRDFATWRALAAHSDMLVASMVGLAYSTDGHGRLVAEMLRELPREHPIPQSCRVAMRPAAAGEMSLCQAMRGEWAFVSGAMESLRNGSRPTTSSLTNFLFPLVYNHDKTIALSAVRFAASCREAEFRRISGDRRIESGLAPQPSLLSRECIDNFAGCLLDGIAAPAYDGYRHRAQDHGARLQVLGTLLWLRDRVGDDRPLAARIADRPRELKSAMRDVELGDDGRVLRIRQYDASGNRGEYWQVRLPDYLVESPPSG